MVSAMLAAPDPPGVLPGARRSAGALALLLLLLGVWSGAALVPNRTCLPRHAHSYILVGDQGKAGIDDRITIIAHIAQLGGFLGARIGFTTPPRKALETLHNHGKKVPSSLDWGDYFHVQFGDGTLALLNTSEAKRLHKHARHAPPAAQVTIESQTRPSHTWALVVNGTMSEQYFDALTFARYGYPFIWLLQSWYYNWHHELQVNIAKTELTDLPWVEMDEMAKWLPEPLLYNASNPVPHEPHRYCLYANVSWAPTVLKLRDRFLSEFNLKPFEFLFMHLRRGDSVNAIDTTPPTVLMYVNCTFRAHPGLDLATMPLAIVSDAPQVYLDSIGEVLTAAGVHTGRKVFPDASLLSWADDDNYMAMLGNHALKDSSFASLRRDRTKCTTCKGDCRPCAYLELSDRSSLTK